jgi:hypothetical protein
MIERETRYVINHRRPKVEFRCSSDPALVAKVLKARRFHCIGESVHAGKGEYRLLRYGEDVHAD